MRLFTKDIFIHANTMNNEQKAYKGCGWTLIAFLFLLAAVLIFGSCTTTRYVTVPEIHTDTLIQNTVLKDSVFLHDSIYQKEKGDTILIEKWHTKYRERLVHDTLYQHRVDTIAKPYPVPEYVEKKLSWWQRLRLHLGNIMLVLIGAAVLYAAAKIYLRFRP